MTTAVSCRFIGADDEAAYTALLMADPGNLIYATLPFLAFLRQVTRARVDVIVAEVGSVMVGALPFAVLGHDEKGFVLNSLPWWGSHGSVVINRNRPDAVEIRAALLRALVREIDRIMPLSSTIVLLPEEDLAQEQYLSILRPDVVEARSGQMTILPQGNSNLETELLGIFKTKTRNLVRKSFKQGFEEVVSDEDWAWNYLFETHAQNIGALGGAVKPQSHFLAVRNLIPAKMRRLSLAMYDGSPVAAMLTLSFNGTIEYLTPAISVEHRSRQPLSYLIMNGMMEAIRRGHHCWNWGGTWSTQTALHHFKAGFGAEDRPYSYLVKASSEGLEFFKSNRNDLRTRFPYFYTYPYGLLDDPA